MKGLYEKYCGCNYRVNTDSRVIEGGEIFFALRGENFDGNAYAMKALQDGARWAVVNRDADLPEDERLIKVDDPFTTLQQLAVYHRNHVLEGRRLPVIGLTGTNGKTTTKELISAVLARKFKVTATQGNLNNDIGVPLSLLKITPETQIAVIEMGASHPDDIAKLVQVSQPDYGLITNVGRAHLLGFGSFEGVKAAKGELYKYLSSRNGSVVFLNNDDLELRSMSVAWVKSHIWPYGVRYDGARVLETSPQKPFLRIRLKDGTTVCTNLVGSYNASNVMAALAVGRYFGVPDADAVAAVQEYVPKNNRSQLQRSACNTLIVDAYNANPTSMGAALDNFGAMNAASKLALLGDMRELGEESLNEHRKIVRRLHEENIPAIVVGEEFGKALKAEGLELQGWFETSDALASFLEQHPVKDSAVLIKGSRGIRMEKVIEKL
ncbi:MAG: UDP-N-acetylmuramoyl-tripeptide--D-alanyl-D-alanine ligase [Bacteroidales bacterium]|nr:UDP-N-acetylmuramoyl-tripeptide--D-alanyl-D-alanine ligase [Candidatus Cryptobacteroides fimicaballi]